MNSVTIVGPDFISWNQSYVSFAFLFCINSLLLPSSCKPFLYLTVSLLAIEITEDLAGLVFFPKSTLFGLEAADIIIGRVLHVNNMFVGEGT